MIKDNIEGVSLCIVGARAPPHVSVCSSQHGPDTDSLQLPELDSLTRLRTALHDRPDTDEIAKTEP